MGPQVCKLCVLCWRVYDSVVHFLESDQITSNFIFANTPNHFSKEIQILPTGLPVPSIARPTSFRGADCV